jgi:hypothetical protein
MRLSDLDPQLVGTLEGGRLHFTCPFPGHRHGIVIYVHREPYGEKVPDPALCGCGEPHRFWQAIGEFPDTLTLVPSINADSPEYRCWHGFITNGDAQ